MNGRAALNDYFSRRGRAGFSMFKPYEIAIPEDQQQQPQQEEQGGIAAALTQALPAILNSKRGKENEGAPRAGDVQGRPSPTGTDEYDVNAEAQDYFQQRQRPKPSRYEGARTEYETALNAPIKKMKPWQDGLYKAAIIASNIFNPQNQQEVVGYGRAKYNRNLERASGKYAAESQIEDQRIGNEYKQTQTANLRAKPQIEQDKISARFKSETQRQLNRLEVLREKDSLAGKQWTAVSRNGKFYKKYKSGQEEPLIDSSTGEQERDLLNEPIETTSETGAKGYAKFGTVLSTEATKAYRDATLELGRDRLESQVDEKQKDRDAAKDRVDQQIKAADDQTKKRLAAGAYDRWLEKNPYATEEEKGAQQRAINTRIFGN